MLEECPQEKSIISYSLIGREKIKISSKDLIFMSLTV
jgi:hypothetical protein